MMLPASIQVCPVELPGRGRREGEEGISDVRSLARALARHLPLADKPYAFFGTCLGAIVGYEVAREVEETRCAPMPSALFLAAVSPPHLYADAVAALYMKRPLRACGAGRSLGIGQGSSALLSMHAVPVYSSNLRPPRAAGRGGQPPMDEVLANLRGWRGMSRAALLRMFEGGHFAGVEELRTNDRLFAKVAPMGVNDIMMAVQYRCVRVCMCRSCVVVALVRQLG